MSTKLYRHYCLIDAAYGTGPSAEGLTVWYSGGTATPVPGIAGAPGSAVEFYSPGDCQDYNLYQRFTTAALAAGDIMRASFWYRWLHQGANGHVAINYYGTSQMDTFLMGMAGDPQGLHSITTSTDGFTSGTAEFMLPREVWHWVEMEVVLHPTAGTAKLWANGILVASLTDLPMSERIGNTFPGMGFGGSSAETGTRFQLDEVTFSINDVRAFADHALSPRSPNRLSPGGRILCPRRLANKVS